MNSKNIGFTENELSHLIIGFAIEIHTAIGPGLLEKVYKDLLYHKMKKAGFYVEKEKKIAVKFEGIQFDCGYRADLVVENKLLIEVKAVEQLMDKHFAQTLTYLRLGDYHLGLLINFNELLLKDGIRRVVNKF